MRGRRQAHFRERQAIPNVRLFLVRRQWSNDGHHDQGVSPLARNCELEPAEESMRQLVPDELTPLSLEETIEAFAKAHVRCMGLEPTAGTLACLVAQSALETGNWHSIHNFNFGNSKAGPLWDGAYCMFRCNEIINGEVRWFDPPHPQTWFRAFTDAASGAFEQVKFLATLERYKGAWHACCAGDAHAFAMSLGEEGYFTADRVSYSSAVQKIAARILPACASYLAGEGHRVTGDDKAYVESLVFRTLDENRGTDPSELAPESVA
jgi:hypothetical protein